MPDSHLLLLPAETLFLFSPEYWVSPSLLMTRPFIVYRCNRKERKRGREGEVQGRNTRVDTYTYILYPTDSPRIPCRSLM